MDTFQKIVVFIAVLQAVRAVVERLLKGRGQAAPAKKAPLAGAEATAAPSPEALLAWGRSLRDRLVEAVAEGDRMQAKARALAAGLGHAAGPMGRVRDALRDADEALEATLGRLRAQSEVALSGDTLALVELALAPDALKRLFEQMGLARARINALGRLAEWRTDRALADAMADADALAGALLRPIQRFADAHDLTFPRLAPICAPAAPGAERVLHGLFPEHPIVFVPDDFADDLRRWPAVAHEVGRVMWWSLEGFAAELRSMVPSTEPAWLPQLHGRRLVFDFYAAFREWLPVVVADALATLLLGPAALRGMVHALARPDDADSVLRVGTGGDGRIVAALPPADLRVRLSAWLLERIGYEVEAKELLRGWDRQHGAPELLQVPTLHGEEVAAPTRLFVEVGAELLEAIYTTRLDSLGGDDLTAVHDLQLRPGLWAKVQARARDFDQGRAFVDDPRVVIAAAIEASELSRGSQARLVRAARAAIIGEGQRREPTRPRPPPARTLGVALDVDEVADAVILAEVLSPRFRRARRAHR